jgi:hypothetical protein
MDRDHNLTTADLARGGEEFRGRSEEEIIAREQQTGRVMADAPAAPPAGAAERAPAAPRSDNPMPRHENRPAAMPTDTRVNDARPHDTRAALFAETEATQLRERWTDVQSGFVDEPRAAVERADSLVAEVMKRLAEGFAKERSALEHQWDRGDNVTTEDLRVALQRYRSFFDRLLQI